MSDCGQSTLDITGNTNTPLKVSLINYLGEIIWSNTIKHEKSQYDFSTIPTGIYFIVVYGKNETGVKKLVKY
jgi:hypothetical protein